MFLEGKSAIVTGSTSGIGLGIATALAGVAAEDRTRLTATLDRIRDNLATPEPGKASAHG